MVFLPFDAANLALEVAKKALHAANLVFQAAKSALEVGRKAVAVGLDLAANLTGRALGEIIQVRKIDFDVDIRQLENFRIDAGAVVILFGKEYNLRISFGLNTKEIIKSLLKKLKPGLFNILGLRKRRNAFGNNRMRVPILPLYSKKERKQLRLCSSPWLLGGI